ncbi:toxin ParE1/3/4 [Ensifer adhaerens]|nr:toxin ParE1/3/4 [Ensifer adhaerens]
MPSAKQGRYRLTPQAISDLEAIWAYGAEVWSVEQAEAYTDELTRIFNLIATFPEIAREYREFSTPVRVHTHRTHIVIYVTQSDYVLIVRILGGRQDWQKILASIDP